jgi:hypothetical protein
MFVSLGLNDTDRYNITLIYPVNEKPRIYRGLEEGYCLTEKESSMFFLCVGLLISPYGGIGSDALFLTYGQNVSRRDTSDATHYG